MEVSVTLGFMLDAFVKNPGSQKLLCHLSIYLSIYIT